ncbi:MAG: zinc ribbon domain-containing protein [Deltaproteobacteria bacterium]|nr:zinc ribbon domain-containing protein [Deltaproteobacteria bacterium]MBW2661665.1 zinc ribbon domain-containing protein [Deltaproteobacteria bacterium]
MPIYEYKCEKCNHSFEKLVFSSDKKVVICPKCNNKDVKRLLSSTCFINSAGNGGCSTRASSGFS